MAKASSMRTRIGSDQRKLNQPAAPHGRCGACAILFHFNPQHADVCASIATARKNLIRMAVSDHNGALRPAARTGEADARDT
jgi:hypothetical protein